MVSIGAAMLRHSLRAQPKRQPSGLVSQGLLSRGLGAVVGGPEAAEVRTEPVAVLEDEALHGARSLLAHVGEAAASVAVLASQDQQVEAP